jgi:hypothetical protein
MVTGTLGKSTISMSIKAGRHFRANERWGTNNIKTQNVALTSALLTETAFTLQSAVDAQ